MTAPLNAFHMPHREAVADDEALLMGDGDVAIILKANGTVQPISVGLDPARAQEIIDAVGTRKLTGEEIGLLEQGRRLMAMMMAASSPVIMTILFEIMDNDQIIDPAALDRLRNAH